MTASEPRPVSRRAMLRGAAIAGAGVALSPLLNLSSAAAAATSGTYTIRFDQAAKQTILGLGFEIQSDSIGSNNNGLPDTVSGVPYDLTVSERDRFVQQMLKGGRTDRGFRYCRLAMGLYYRGLDSTRKFMQSRYPGQDEQLAEMIAHAGIEGTSVEYWSPAPGWKSNNSYIGGTLSSFDPAFLSQFGDALVADLDHLIGSGIPVAMWGLQNEPLFTTPYSSCVYNASQYLAAFKAVAPKIRAKYPHIMITADSQHGWSGAIGQALAGDAQALSNIDAWTYHQIGTNSNEQLTPGAFTSGARGKLVFNNEFEYLDNATSNVRTINTAQSIMNWMVFQNAPTWFWLHALKPTANAESPGYSLGFWRPPSDTNFSHFPNLPVGHWTWNPQNWNAVHGFVKYMPWNSVRYGVDESAVLPDQRIMAWKTAQGKPVFAITNRSNSPFTYTVDTQTAAQFHGARFGPSTNNLALGAKAGPQLTITVPPLSIEFWIRTP
ncbi:hypothetical protein [Streptomyces sp. BE303]|uniref:hypothetical protein n=1 Tax=Streptomyces sp. BE303 TaxID=3002528 RepID=UPI002E78B650|nr:hypothetical protein [Streptomyces sp. BE303]MED7949799.1 hypothetical protein [Streptomyces sp. BE303]